MSRTAVITGGSSGLGFAMAENLGKQGFNLQLIARDLKKLTLVKNQLEEKGYSVTVYSCDVRDHRKLDKIHNSIKQSRGAIDFLILNAGVVRPTTLSDHLDLDAIKEEIDIDLFGVIAPTKVFLPLLKETSRILYISSGFGLMGTAGYSIYCAAKAGVVNFAAAMRHELQSKKIAVYVACPADIDTPQFHKERADMPEWMRVSQARGAVMSATETAERIISRCKGGRFKIVINMELKLLLLLVRLLPERTLLLILGRMFPKPSNLSE